MTRKRLQSILLVTVLCIIAVCVFASCNKKQQEHVHEYGEWAVVREATCESDGLKERTCNGCDQTEQETIAALGHSYGEWVAEVAATCTTTGKKGHYECSVCHKTFDADKHELSDLTIAKADHTYGTWVAEVAATCKTEGVKGHYECSVCHKNFDADKHELSDLTIAKADHTYGTWVAEVAATCKTEGVKGHYECSVCHKNFDADKHELSDLTIEKSNHTYGEWIDEIPTTCTAEGAKGHYHCSVCNKDFDADNNELTSLTIAKSHVLNFVEGRAATCVDEGVKDAYRCAVCRKYFDKDGNVLSDLVISAKGHRYGANIAEVAATATENGVKEHKDCLDCGLHFDLDGNELETLIIPATQHVCVWVDEVPATCEVDGVKAHYACSHCSLVFDKDYNVVSDLTIAHGHDFKSYERVEATCVYNGHVAYDYCKKCDKYFDKDGNELDDVTIPSLGHDLGQWIDEVPATCTTNGTLAHQTCSRCHEHFDEEGDMYHSIEIPAHHDCTLVAEVPATCTTSGMQAHGQCAACGKTLDSFGNEVTDAASLVIPAKGHNLGDWVEGITATCNESGILGHYHCVRCEKDFDRNGAEIAEVIVQPIAHVYTTDEIIARVEATCTEDGAVAHFTCTLCDKHFDENGEEIEDVVIEKTGHTYKQDSWVVGTSATCTEDGTMGHYVCPTCNEAFSTIDYKKSLTAEDLVIKARGHRYDHYDKVEPTCEDDGTAEHYYCDRCNEYFDADKNEVEFFDDLTLAALGHVLGELISGTNATSTERGTIAHYECSSCHKTFDEDRIEVDTIYLPETEHDFENWIPEVLPTCDTAGSKGYYECSHCGGFFDRDYQKVEEADLVIPARHKLNDLVPASQGKCDDPDVLVSYYYCAACNSYFTEDMTEIEYNDIFVYAGRHNLAYTCNSDGWGHTATCLDCDYYATYAHELTYSYSVKDGEYIKVGHCDECGFDEEPEEYTPVESVTMKYDFYVGYHDEYSWIVFVKFLTYTGDRQMANVLSSAEYEKFEKDVEDLQGITEPVTKTYAVSYDNYTGTLNVTFRPYKIYGIVTEYKFYREGTSLDDVEFVIDSNFTRETGEVVYADGSVTDNGGFDANYDFAAAGKSEVTFAIKYLVGEQSYDVDVTLVNVAKPYRFSNDYVHSWIVRGQTARIGVYYTDGNYDEIEITDDIIVDGSFDSSVLGKQTFTVNVDGLEAQISITVLEPYDVISIDFSSQKINVGEDLYIYVNYACGRGRNVKVTPDMIIGKFDNTVAGYYEINIEYEGWVCYACIDVIDPTDSRVENISVVFDNNTTYLWNVDDDGNIVPNLEYLYLAVYRKNDTMSYVQVTENMISYDEAAAMNAYTYGGMFEVKITYYGKTRTITVAPRKVADFTVTSLRILEKANLSHGNCQYVFVNDGDFSKYYVELRTAEGVYFAALDKSMFYDRDSQNAFDFATAENNKSYDAIVKRDNAERDVHLCIYTESDVQYSISAYDNLYNITVGTREEVLAQLVGKKFSLNMHVCNNSSWVKYFYFEDLIVAPNADVDFSKPGMIELEVSYQGVVSCITISLIPNVEGVAKTIYTLDGDEFVMYANGSFSMQYSGWGSYTLVNEELGIYRLVYFDGSRESFVQINGESAIEFRAEMLEDNLEEYLLYTIEGVGTAKIYTKNGFSMADIYDGEGYYQRTTLAVFSLDGKSVRLMGIKYDFGKNGTLDIAAEGNVVYRARDDQSGNMITRYIFNDNGKMYLIVVELDEGGNEIAENVFATYDWDEKDGVITIYEDGMPATTGRIENGYFVFDIL